MSALVYLLADDRLRRQVPLYAVAGSVGDSRTLAGTLEQPKQGHALCSTGSAPEDDDVVWLGRCELQKVIPIAGQKYATSLMGKMENCLVG